MKQAGLGSSSAQSLGDTGQTPSLSDPDSPSDWLIATENWEQGPMHGSATLDRSHPSPAPHPSACSMGLPRLPPWTAVRMQCRGGMRCSQPSQHRLRAGPPLSEGPRPTRVLYQDANRVVLGNTQGKDSRGFGSPLRHPTVLSRAASSFRAPGVPGDEPGTGRSLEGGRERRGRLVPGPPVAEPLEDRARR